MFVAEQINPVINRKGVGKSFFATNFVQREIRGRLRTMRNVTLFCDTMHFEK